MKRGHALEQLFQRIQAICEAAGLLLSLEGASTPLIRLDLDNDPYEPLLIATWTPPAPLPGERYRLQVAHVGWTSRGLPFPDPELELAVMATGEAPLPVRMRQTVLGIRETPFLQPDLSQDQRAVRDASELWSAWARALRWQRWEQAAAEARPRLQTVLVSPDDDADAHWLETALCQAVPLLREDQAHLLISAARSALRQGGADVQLLCCNQMDRLASALRSWGISFRVAARKEEG
ncbi:MAG: hypothetical protein IMW90_22365 [Thermogemmatispora sp.]|jgi:hypothetical protein|uniref:DUF6908 domain-containing protein n=1 Tax=Thermogemmatispora sp. TaxID=1968838 RepID=UPI0019F9B19E|nr:hypothetical protein [Thermogemmatispora sp.]MBE3568469.1 hypothetical protein [Thermogemmatispora sp.]